MKKVCNEWGITMADHFAGAQLLRPYSKDKLLTARVEKKGKGRGM
jgi:hypothetical protein